jgi:hypothetical protein
VEGAAAGGGWTEAELAALAGTEELRLAVRRPDGELSRFVTVWVVRAGNDLYVRSAYGPDNPWYRRARASGSGRLRGGGVEKDVRFAPVPPDVHPALDAEYHRKYDRHGAAVVGTVVGPQVRELTIRLAPR